MFGKSWDCVKQRLTGGVFKQDDILQLFVTQKSVITQASVILQKDIPGACPHLRGSVICFGDPGTMGIFTAR